MAGFFAVLWAFFLAGTALGGELTLYFYPSPGLDWSSPKTLGRSAIGNTISGADHGIGHVSVEVACADGTGLLAGATGANGDATRDLVLSQGYGLGLLFHDFPDGRLYTRGEIEAELPPRYESGKLTYARFKISEGTCERLVRYHDEYLANGYDTHYGLVNRPLHREGAGCTAFGVSFLEAAGLLDPSIEGAFARNYIVPASWIGGPMTGNFIPVRRFYNPLYPSRWATSTEGGFFIHFYDADLMDAWVRGIHTGQSELPGFPLVQLERRGRALGAAFDATGVLTPDGPIWKN